MDDQNKPIPPGQAPSPGQPNAPLTAISKVAREVLANFSTPGSMEAAAVTRGQRLCPQCHALVRENASFCQNCGAKVLPAVNKEARGS